MDPVAAEASDELPNGCRMGDRPGNYVIVDRAVTRC